MQYSKWKTLPISNTIKLLFQSKKYHEVVQFMDKAVSNHYIPNSDVAAYYLRSLTLLKQYEKAELFWTIDTGRYQIQFNNHFYNSIFFLYSYQHNWKMSNSILELMKVQNIPTEDWVLTSSFRTHLMLGHQRETIELWKQIQQQKTSTKSNTKVMDRLADFVLTNSIVVPVPIQILNASIHQLVKSNTLTNQHIEWIYQYYSKEIHNPTFEKKFSLQNILSITRLLLETKRYILSTSSLSVFVQYLIQNHQYHYIETLFTKLISHFPSLSLYKDVIFPFYLNSSVNIESININILNSFLHQYLENYQVQDLNISQLFQIYEKFHNKEQSQALFDLFYSLIHFYKHQEHLSIRFIHQSITKIIKDSKQIKINPSINSLYSCLNSDLLQQLLYYSTKTEQIKKGIEIHQYILHQYSTDPHILTNSLLDTCLSFSISRKKPLEGIEWYYILKRKDYLFSPSNYSLFLELSSLYNQYSFGTKILSELLSLPLFYYNGLFYKNNSDIPRSQKINIQQKLYLIENENSTFIQKKNLPTTGFQSLALSKSIDASQNQIKLFGSIYKFLYQSNYKIQLLQFIDTSIRLYTIVDDSLFSTIIDDIYTYGEWEIIHEWFTIMKSRYPFQELSKSIPKMTQFYIKTGQIQHATDFIIELKNLGYQISIQSP